MKSTIIKNILKLFILCLCCSTYSVNAFASHAAGADLTYQCVDSSQNKYKITLAFYRDCSGMASAPTSPSVTYQSTSCNVNRQFTLSPILGTGQEVKVYCSGTRTTCSFPTFPLSKLPGFQKDVYEGIVILPKKCSDWVFSYSLNARNQHTNVVGTGDLYVEAHLDNLNTPCHDSPQFTNPPVALFCVGSKFCYNHGVVVPLGDSLHYEFITPKISATGNIFYISPFTAQQPVSSNPPISLDPNTGDFCITPTNQETSAMALKVTQWRNGIEIGSVIRDIQIAIIACTNKNPFLTGINGTNVFKDTVCPEKQIAFDIFSNDSNATDSLTMTWNKGISGASFTAGSGQHPTGSFSWTPSKDYTNTTQCFTVKIEDNHCPLIGMQIYSFCIYVEFPRVNTIGGEICRGDSTTLFAQGSSTKGTYTWSPTNKTGQTIKVAPINTTTYTVNFVSSMGCKASDTAIVQVRPWPEVKTTGGAICKDDSITLTTLVDHSGGSYLWAPTNEMDSSIRVNPNTTTTYTVTYTDSFGCENTDSAVVVVNPTPKVTAIGGAICEGDSITIAADVSPGGGDFSWSYKNSTDSIIKISPPKTTTDTITYTSLAGCTNSDTAIITVNPIPTVQVDNDTICFGDTATLSAIVSPGGGSFVWSPSNQTDSIIKVSPTSTTTYTVTYTSLKGCVFQDSAVVKINPLPIVDFELTNVCSDSTTIFTDKSTVPGKRNVIGWHWNFGDGDTANVQDPNHTYPRSDTYKVMLTATSNNGCVDSTSKKATVFPVPTPKFDIKYACLGEPVILTDKSIGNIIQWEWDVDNDGVTDYTTDSVSHTYPAEGSYLVHLKVTTNHGCSTDTTEMAIVSDPKAAFSASTACADDATHFTDHSSSSTTSWNWNFGDSSTSSKQNPNHTYPSSGTYITQLIIEGVGCKDTIQHTVIVKQNPSANFTWNIACSGDSTLFTNVTGATTNNNYQWDFGDKSGTYTDENPKYGYNSGGIYKVRLTATSDSGCVDTISHIVNIPYTPIAEFSYDTVCSGNITCFKDLSSVLKDSIAKWTWWWGDNTPNDTTQNPCHKYDSAGTYTVRLTVASANGCISDTMVHQVTVNDNPIAEFKADDVCQDIAATFNNKSIDNNKNIWYFGDGDSSKSKNPSHQYQSSGTYQVTLIATNKFGCKDTVADSINIFPLPIAMFDVKDACLGDSVILTDKSIGKIAKWEWDVDNDGITDDITSIMSHAYPKNGTYKIKLTVTNIYGCKSDTTMTAIVSSPTADFSYSQTCDGDTMYFTDESSPNPSDWNWYFGDSHTSSKRNTTHVFGDTGTYNVKLTITSKGCKDSIIKQVLVDPNPVTHFTGENLEGCTPWCAKLFDSSSISTGSIANWQWDLGDRSKQNGQQITACYKNKGQGLDKYPITLIVTSNKGCRDTAIKADYISIFPRPKTAFKTDPRKGDSYHKKIHFIDESVGASIWHWDFGDGTDSSFMKSPIHQYKDTGSYMVYLKVENRWGCADSIRKLFEIEPVFSLYIPDAFTPDNDNLNDFFYAKGYALKHLDMYIYNRWGELLYEGHEKDSKWDGTYQGKPVPPEVYVYKIIAESFNGIYHTYRGHVTLLR